MGNVASTAVDTTLLALSDPTRRQVVELLRSGPRRASDLADQVGATRPAMSRHLRVLRTHGLVRDTGIASDARVRVYRLEPAPFRALRDWLDEIESLWTAQLAAFVAHVDGGDA